MKKNSPKLKTNRETLRQISPVEIIGYDERVPRIAGQTELTFHSDVPFYP